MSYPTMKKLVIVVGAHRSGTSLCAAGIKALGADTCISGLYKNDENEKGFFEHPEIIKFNESLLEHLGGSWDNPFFNGIDACKDQSILSWLDSARDLVVKNFSVSNFTVIKDPRFCQLLGFWVRAFSASGFKKDEIFIIHIFRDPLEVAASQVNRVRTKPEYYELGRYLNEAALLWYSLTLQALTQSMGHKSYFISYTDLLEQPEKTLQEMADFLGIEAVQVSEEIEKFSRYFVEKNLRHQISNTDKYQAFKGALPEVYELYELLADIKAQQQISAENHLQIEQLFHKLHDHLPCFATNAISRLSHLSRIRGLQVVEKNNVIEQLNGEVVEFEKDRDNIRAAFQIEQEKLREEYEKQIKSINIEKNELQNQLSDKQPQIDEAVQARKEIDEVTNGLLTELESVKSELRHSEFELKRLSDMVRDYRDQCERLESIDSEFEKVRKDNAHMSYLLNEMRNSSSWRRTAPLRWIKSEVSGISLGKYWVNVRRFSQSSYNSLYKKNPKLSRVGRKALSPIFYFVDKKLDIRRQALAGSQSYSAGAAEFDQIYQQPALVLTNVQPKVSVIVPNYNHSAFLRERLESIYNQTYEHIEVILLDDCSTDSSVDVLREFELRYPDKTKLIVNDTNSGGVFQQWKKGLQMASGDLVWVAESDDFCKENFLETLVPFFRNEAVTLTYSETIFVKGAQAEPVWSIQEYLSDIDTERWRGAFVETGHEIVQSAFALKNIIPNVSSAVFRNLHDFDVFHDPQWMKMRTCGDWILYLHVIRGGMLAYSPDTTNYYRLHDTNTSLSSYKDDVFYMEHEQVAKTVQRYFKVSKDVFVKQKANLEEHWLRTRPEFSQAQFEACYSLNRISEESSERAINLMMAGYAFSAGGGETFPIMLANLLKGIGYNITFVDCNQEPRIEAIRRSLRADIPVVSDIANISHIVDKFGIDIIHSHHGWVDNTILELLPDEVDCKTVVTLHGFYETVDDEDLEILLPRLMRRSARLIYTAEKNLGAIERFKLVDDEKIERIDNALAIEPFEPIDRSRYGIPETAFLLTLVSRAIPDKGWSEAIEAVTKARQLSEEDIHLILIGEGPVYDKLNAKVLPNYIHLLGFRKNLRDFFAASDMGFLPSRFEGESFPLVIIDCLHAGTPVLASSIGEIPYMLETDNGMAGELFALKGWAIDVDVLAEKISSLAKNRARLELLTECVPLAAAVFDPELLAERYDGVYRKCLSP